MALTPHTPRDLYDASIIKRMAKNPGAFFASVTYLCSLADRARRAFYGYSRTYRRIDCAP